ncbi:unnamed protein product [Adineta steineri]|uniref:NHL repeat containing protein n=1 Tax=Adineta steineri TaxID=433720 RepID=A0A815SEF9_9BILA|nr:unnamed protein product [Adineta steineri]CAF1487047.1 unnamed protein product [Adineta steineri]
MIFSKKNHKLTISLPLSFNQPKFSPAATWNSNGIIIANRSIVGERPAIFVNTDNTIYVANRENNKIIMWQEESANPTKTIRGNFTPDSLFVISNGDIYIDDGVANGRVQKWIAETNIFVTVMNVNSSCEGLFVDINDTLYCSMYGHHQVVKRSLINSVIDSNHVAAGTGIQGSDPNQLNQPHGIFVDANLDLYVADFANDRVQLFQSGKSNGITVAGSTSLNPTIKLSYPSGVVLDAEKYLFIADQFNHRIVGSGLNGFRCLVGCYGVGSQSNQLYKPFSFSFDRSGNIFVPDQGNHRIQKFLLMKDSFALSFNRPKFCSTATWNPTGITFANQSIVGQQPIAIFVNTNNTIFVANRQNNTIVMWQEKSVNPTKIISGNFTGPMSLFVLSNGDIYIDDGYENDRVQKWIAETNTFVTVMNVNSYCADLFVDINNTLYCSIGDHHRVVKRSLNDSLMTLNRNAAGTGTLGSASNQFNGPVGIFVDANLDLYVTDCDNDRVQLFQSGESNGITVVGRASLNPTITLLCPTKIILDTEKYLFIADNYNNRIVGSDSNGFQCLFGCYGMGSQSNQLDGPFSFSFDHSGNMFVTDQNNHRIQKFQYYEESCKLDSYYEAIQMDVTITGYYAFLINSKMKTTYGCIYKSDFNPFDVAKNMIKYNGDYERQGQFEVTAILEANIKYVFVITTSTSNITGDVSIQVSGQSYIGFSRILNTSSVVQTVYASKLATNSSTYSRRCSSSNSYYKAIQVNVRRSGFYTFFSKSNMDTYGSLYKDYFDPSTPRENQLVDDDKRCNQKQFTFTIALETSITYTLVVTTWNSYTTGEFSIFVSGPDNVDLKNISKCLHYNYEMNICQC